ncbi:MAG: hypothetical protein AAGE52_02040 [Myxococcota bacterium]
MDPQVAPDRLFHGLPVNLRPGLSRLFGRAALLREIRSLVHKGSRLITLTGLPGVGKSRLAYECVRQIGRSAIHLVELDGCESLDAIERRVRETLRWGDDDSLLWRAEGVVVLDGCPEPIASRLVDWWKHSQLTFLATASKRFGLPFEAPVAIPALPLPDSPDNPCVRLFLERARSARASFDPASQWNEVIELCHLADGIPRHLEWAASQLSTLSLGQVVTAMRDRPLGGEELAALSEELHEHLRQLSVFPVGFDLQAARAVVPDSAEATQELVDRTLIEVAFPPDEPPRFRVPHFVATRLGDPPDAVRISYAAHFTSQARVALKEIEGSWEALPYSLENFITAYRINGAWEPWLLAAELAMLQGRSRTVLEIAAEVHRLNGETADARARMHNLCARAYARMQNPEQVCHEARSSLRLAETVQTRVHGAIWYAYGLFRSGREAEAAGAMRKLRDETSDDALRSEIDAWWILTAVDNTGVPEAAAQTHQATLQLKKLGRPRALAIAYRNLGVLAIAMNDWGQAAYALAEAKDLSTQLDDRTGATVAGAYLGQVEATEGRFDAAHALLERSLRGALSMGMHELAGLLAAHCAAVALALDNTSSFDEHLALARRIVSSDAKRAGCTLALVELLSALVQGRTDDAHCFASDVEQLALQMPAVEREGWRALVAYLWERRTTNCAEPEPVKVPDIAMVVRIAQALGPRLEGETNRIVLAGGWVKFGQVSIDLSRRRAMWRMLCELGRLRQVGAAPATVERLFAVGWPGEKAHPEAAAKRVYTGIWSLRKMGLAPVLERFADGYRIVPSWDVDTTDPI